MHVFIQTLHHVHKAIFKYSEFEFRTFPSPRPVALLRLKITVCIPIKLFLSKKEKGLSLSLGNKREVKCKVPRPEFELRSSNPLPMMITVSPSIEYRQLYKNVHDSPHLSDFYIPCQIFQAFVELYVRWRYASLVNIAISFLCFSL